MTGTEPHDTLERRLARTLAAKAARVQPNDVHFDATVVPATLAVTHGSPRHAPGVTHRATPRVLPALDSPVLVPASPPAGMQLWSIHTSPDQTGGAAARTQLFGSVGADGAPTRALLVELAPGTSGRPFGSQTVRVRGHEAGVNPSKGGGGGVGATALDHLRARSTNLLDGFDPASAPAGLGLLGETTPPTAPGVDAILAYGAHPALTSAAPDAVMTTSLHASYPGYLRTWIAGSRGPDGAAVEFDRGWDVVVAWPDGRQVLVQTQASDPAPFERSARSASTVGLDGLRSVRADVDRRLAALPLLGAADLPTARLELHGEGSPAALCLRVATSSPACGAFELRPTSDWATGIAASAIVDGRWVVFAGSPSPVSVARPSVALGDHALPVESATAAGWNVVLAAVPDGLDQVEVEVTHGNQGAGVELSRPRA
jgi:hypothetical protein